MKSLSLTARISLLFAVAASVVLLTTGYFLTLGVDAHFREGDRHELEGKLELIENLFRHADRSSLPQQLSDALVGHHGLAVAVADARGDIWFATPGAGVLRTLLRTCRIPSTQCRYGTVQQWHQDGTAYRGTVASIPVGSGELHTVAVAQDIERHEMFMRTFRLVLGVAITLAALATAALGWLVARWGLLPLRHVTDMAARVSAERLGERLPAASLPAELEPLATAFNAMLARLDDSFRRLSEFSANIAHELRTPISSLMTQTQVALSGARNQDEYKEVLYSSLEEYERMAQMVGDMLYLAKTDNGLLKPNLEMVNLADETRDLFDYFEAWAEERAVSLLQTGTAKVPGDRLMLRRALSNLVSNAIRHTPQGLAVRVTMAMQGTTAALSVENPGTEIPPEAIPRLFDRFYRADASRQRQGDGAGLGLAIVKSIVDAHGGSIAVTSSNQTTRFQITLPAAAG